MENWTKIAASINPAVLTPRLYKTPDMSEALRDRRLADYQFEILVKTIQEFEAGLQPDQEVAIMLASFGQTVVMEVKQITYSNPSLIHFRGYVDGCRAELVQHVHQLNFLLTTVQLKELGKPARRIGFAQEDIPEAPPEGDSSASADL